MVTHIHTILPLAYNQHSLM